VQRALQEYLKTGRLDIPDDEVDRVRSQRVWDPIQDASGLLLPPWRLERQTAEGVELRWTIDLGHESGTRRWFSARVDRKAGGWRVRDVTAGSGHLLKGGPWR
jgi:hypothetical protein